MPKLSRIDSLACRDAPRCRTVEDSRSGNTKLVCLNYPPRNLNSARVLPVFRVKPELEKLLRQLVIFFMSESLADPSSLLARLQTAPHRNPGGKSTGHRQNQSVIQSADQIQTAALRGREASPQSPLSRSRTPGRKANRRIRINKLRQHLPASPHGGLAHHSD